MKKFRVLLAAGVLCVLVLTLHFSVAAIASNFSGAENQNRAVSQAQADEQAYKQQFAGIENPDVEISKGSDDFCEERANRHDHLQKANDQIAMDALRRNSKKTFSKTITEADELAVMTEMLRAIQSGKLDYSEIKPMVLYMACRGDQLDAAFQQALVDAIMPYFETDPDLGSDIAAAYDPGVFGE